MQHTQVAVVGVGTMGSMALWQLSERGVKGVGFEQFAPGHDRGAHGGESRLFRTAYLEGAKYVPILQEAERLWRDLEAKTATELLTMTGGLMIGQTDTDFLANVTASIETYSLEHEVLGPDEARRRYPQHRFSSNDVVVVDKHAGFLRPELSVMAAARRAEELGAEVRRDCRVEALEPSSDGIHVHAGGDTYVADQVVVAAGAWTPLFGAVLPIEITPTRLLLTWFAPREPAAFRPDRFPIFIREAGDDVSYWGVPMIDSFSVKISLHGQFGSVPDPDHLERGTSTAETELIRDLVRRDLPGLIPDPVRIGAYQDGFSGDHDFVVGRHPEDARILLLGGFSGHGFKMAPAIGRIAADLVTEGVSDLPTAHLSPERFRAGSAAQG